AGARGLDETDRGDGLTGAGRVLEPEAPLGAGVLGRLADGLLGVLLDGGLLPVLGLLLGRQLLRLLELRVCVRAGLGVLPGVVVLDGHLVLVLLVVDWHLVL